MKASSLDETLLANIPESPASITAPELCKLVARHSTARAPSLRTIQRSLDRLLAGNIDLERAESKPHRWCWKPGAKRSGTIRMDPATALAFGLLERHLDGLIPAPFRRDLEPLFRKAEELANTLPQSRINRWKARSTTASSAYPLRLPTMQAGVLDDVQKALLDRLQLVILYRANGQDLPREYVLHPQGLILVDGVFYLVATVGDYPAPCQFVLHRIQSTTVSSQTSRDLPDFDAAAYVNKERGLHFKTGDSLTLRLRIRGFLSLHLRERPLSDDQAIRPVDDEWWELSATLPESDQLEWWLGSFGPQCEVLGPARLRRRMAARASQTSELYASTRRPQ